MLSKVIFSFLFFITITQKSYGYLDPGTGSYVIQLLIAGFATLAYGIKFFWSNIKNFFARFKKDKTPKKITPTKATPNNVYEAKPSAKIPPPTHAKNIQPTCKSDHLQKMSAKSK